MAPAAASTNGDPDETGLTGLGKSVMIAGIVIGVVIIIIAVVSSLFYFRFKKRQKENRVTTAINLADVRELHRLQSHSTTASCTFPQNSHLKHSKSLSSTSKADRDHIMMKSTFGIMTDDEPLHSWRRVDDESGGQENKDGGFGREKRKEWEERTLVVPMGMQTSRKAETELPELERMASRR